METDMTDNDKHYVWKVTRIAVISGLVAMMFYSLMGGA